MKNKVYPAGSVNSKISTTSGFSYGTGNFSSPLERLPSDFQKSVRDFKKRRNRVRGLGIVVSSICFVFSIISTFIVVAGCLVLAVLVGRNELNEQNSIEVDSMYRSFKNFFDSSVKMVDFLVYSQSDLLCEDLPDFDKVGEYFYQFLSVQNLDFAYQLRYLTEDGMERIRIDLKDSVLVFAQDLQNKSSRGYTLEFQTGACDNQSCVSRFNLNREHGAVEIPIKPTIRVYLSVLCNGSRSGFIIVNYRFSSHLQEMMNNFEGHSASELIIVSNDGTLLYHSPDRSLEWEPDFGKDISFSDLYGDSAMSLIKETGNGNFMMNKYFYSVRQLSTAKETVSFLVGASMYRALLQGIWILIIGIISVILLYVLCVFLVIFFQNWIVRISLKFALKTQDQLNMRRQEIIELLNSLVPPTIANRLLNGEKVIVYEKNKISICFADIVGFTNKTHDMKPKNLVIWLRRVFHKIDIVMDKFQCYKIKTIGDAYMAVCGIEMEEIVPNKDLENMNNATVMILAAFEILRRVENIRIGLAVGKVVYGVIENHSARFDCWGDKVNLAARLESNGVPNCVNFSKDYLLAIPFEDEIFLDSRMLEIKGFEGKIQCYSSTGFKNEDVKISFLKKIGSQTLKWNESGEEKDEVIHVQRFRSENGSPSDLHISQNSVTGNRFLSDSSVESETLSE